MGMLLVQLFIKRRFVNCVCYMVSNWELQSFLLSLVRLCSETCPEFEFLSILSYEGDDNSVC